MRLSDEQIKKVQTLYCNRFGKEIGYEEAVEKGRKLIQLVELVYRPINAAEYQQSTATSTENRNL